MQYCNSSVIGQKGEYQNGGYKKTKHAKFSEKLLFFTPLILTRPCAYHWVGNVRFLEKIGVLGFLMRLILLPYYRRIVVSKWGRSFALKTI